MKQEDFPPPSTTTSFFLDAELELADEFLSDANTYLEAGLGSAAWDALQNAESAIRIIERYLVLVHQFEGAGTYLTLIQKRRQRALAMQQCIPATS